MTEADDIAAATRTLIGPTSQALGIRILSIARGACAAAMQVRPEMANAHGTCHGGVLFTLGDSTCGFACNFEAAQSVAAGAQIDFLAPALVGDVLTAVATERWQEGRSAVYDVSITNQSGRKIALMRCQSRRLRPRDPSSEVP